MPLRDEFMRSISEYNAGMKPRETLNQIILDDGTEAGEYANELVRVRAAAKAVHVSSRRFEPATQCTYLNLSQQSVPFPADVKDSVIVVDVAGVPGGKGDLTLSNALTAAAQKKNAILVLKGNKNDILDLLRRNPPLLECFPNRPAARN